jgi:AraC family transcriptional regulator
MAERQSSRLLLESPLARVHDVVCRTPRSDYGARMLNAVTQIGLPRRGVFLIERRGEVAVIDTNSVLMLGPDDEYRVAHPAAEGDEGMVLAPRPDLVEDAMGRVEGRFGRLRPRDHFAVRVIDRALRDAGPDQLDAEDATLLLLGTLSRTFADTGNDDCVLGPGQRLRIERARALLASAPAARWDLGALGRALRCSPFHLARQFRAATGETISRYVLRLRLGVALERLAQGQRDIAALAVETGFCHHSHFSARFRSVFGITPSEAREILTQRKVAELRGLLGALNRAETGVRSRP